MCYCGKKKMRVGTIELTTAALSGGGCAECLGASNFDKASP